MFKAKKMTRKKKGKNYGEEGGEGREMMGKEERDSTVQDYI